VTGTEMEKHDITATVLLARMLCHVMSMFAIKKSFVQLKIWYQVEKTRTKQAST